MDREWWLNKFEWHSFVIEWAERVLFELNAFLLIGIEHSEKHYYEFRKRGRTWSASAHRFTNIALQEFLKTKTESKHNLWHTLFALAFLLRACFLNAQLEYCRSFADGQDCVIILFSECSITWPSSLSCPCNVKKASELNKCEYAVK